MFFRTPTSPKTMLPNGLILSDIEKRDLCDLEKTFNLYNFYASEFPEKFNFAHTTNVGIHYFSLERMVQLPALASNKNLTESTIKLMLMKLKPREYSEHRMAAYGLLRNPVVYNDIELFETVFNKTWPSNESDVLITLKDVNISLPISVIMFLLPHINKSAFTQVTSYWMNVVKFREDAILEWVAVNNRELAGLPLSWVVKVYGMNSLEADKWN